MSAVVESLRYKLNSAIVAAKTLCAVQRPMLLPSPSPLHTPGVAQEAVHSSPVVEQPPAPAKKLQADFVAAQQQFKDAAKNLCDQLSAARAELIKDERVALEEELLSLNADIAAKEAIIAKYLQLSRRWYAMLQKVYQANEVAMDRSYRDPALAASPFGAAGTTMEEAMRNGDIAILAVEDDATVGNWDLPDTQAPSTDYPAAIDVVDVLGDLGITVDAATASHAIADDTVMEEQSSPDALSDDDESNNNANDNKDDNANDNKDGSNEYAVPDPQPFSHDTPAAAPPPAEPEPEPEPEQQPMALGDNFEFFF